MSLICCITSFVVLVPCFLFLFLFTCVSLCVFPCSSLTIIFLVPLVPLSGNSLNQSLNPGPEIKIDSKKVIVTHCENRCQPIEATRQTCETFTANCAFFLFNPQEDAQTRRFVSLPNWGYAPAISCIARTSIR